MKSHTVVTIAITVAILSGCAGPSVPLSPPSHEGSTSVASSLTARGIHSTGIVGGSSSTVIVPISTGTYLPIPSGPYLNLNFSEDDQRIFRLAREEKKNQEARERQEYKKRLRAENIDGVYIPKDLGECFSELDKVLSEVDKSEMRALPRKDDMIRFHMGLGTWLRNNWGLWGGSRLKKYFTDRGVSDADEMSGVILACYYDWLNGKKEACKDWKRRPGSR